MTITIEPVRSRRQFDDFVTLPRRLYDRMPGFVAPLDHERRQLLDPRKGAFYTHGEAQYWLARRDGAWVGRISAQIDHLATGPMHEGYGFFGCLDAIDDPAVVAALLGEAEDWLAARGKTRARGPFLLSINGESGLLLDGQDQPPMLLMPWHPAYLRSHLEQAGYALAKLLHSSTLKLDVPALRARLAPLGLDKRREAFVIRPMRMNRLAEDGEAGRQLFNGAWARNWGFVPVSREEMASLLNGFRSLLRPEYGVYVELKGQLVGFALFLPNVFDVSGDLGGALSALGWLRLVYRSALNRFTSGRAVLFGVSAAMVGSISGANVALLLVEELARRAALTHIDTIECGWVLDDNDAMKNVVTFIGATSSRRFGVFEKPFLVPSSASPTPP